MQIILAGTSEEQIWLQQESHKFTSAVLYSRLKIRFSSLFSKDTLVPSPQGGRCVQWGQQLWDSFSQFFLSNFTVCLPARLDWSHRGSAGRENHSGRRLQTHKHRIQNCIVTLQTHCCLYHAPHLPQDSNSKNVRADCMMFSYKTRYSRFKTFKANF